MKKPLLFRSFRYASLVWLSAIIIAPAFYFVLDFMMYRSNDDVFLSIVFSTLYGGLISIPYFLVLTAAVYILGRTQMKIRMQRIVLLIASFVMINLLFFVFLGGDINATEDLLLIGTYVAITSFAVSFFRLEPAEKSASDFDVPLDEF